MKKILVLLFVFVGCCLIARAQDQSVSDTTSTYTESYDDDETEEEMPRVDFGTEKKDFQKATLRLVSNDSIQNIRQGKGFEYMQYIDSFYRNTKSQAETPKETKAQPSTSIFDITAIRVLYWGLALAAILFILYRLFMGNTALFQKNRKINPQETETEEATLSSDSLSKLIEKAIRSKEYRVATRLMYMQLLSQLGDKQLLLLSRQKTNYQYVQELRGNSLQQPFSILTMQYEYAWFGNFPINAQQFEMIRKGYSDFTKML